MSQTLIISDWYQLDNGSGSDTRMVFHTPDAVELRTDSPNSASTVLKGKWRLITENPPAVPVEFLKDDKIISINLDLVEEAEEKLLTTSQRASALFTDSWIQTHPAEDEDDLVDPH